MGRIRDTLIGLVRVIGLALVLLAPAIAAPGKQASAEGLAQGADTPFTRLRFVNAAVDAPHLDALVDGVLWISGLNSAVGYSDLDPGTHTFSFRTVGGAVDLAALRVTVEVGQRVTIAATGRADSLQVLALSDNVDAPPRNAARVRVVNAAPDAGPIRVSLGPRSLANGLDFLHASTPRQLFDGEYDLTITDASGFPLLTERDRQITGNRAITLFFAGSGAPGMPGNYRIVAAESGVLLPPINSQIRFAHAAADVGAVTVYVNNESVPLYPDVPFGSATHYYVTGPGEHRFEVYRQNEGPGQGTPLARATATVGADESLLFVLVGRGEDVALEPFIGDISPLPGGTTRLQVIHAAAGDPALQVERIEGTVLFESVDYLGTASRIVPAGTYNIRFNDAGTDALLMEKTGIELPAGSLTVLLAFDDDPALPFMNAVATSTEYVPQQASVRWVHVNPHLPALDLYLDDQLVADNLIYGAATGYALYEPRAYQLTLHLHGSSPGQVPPLMTMTLDLGFASPARTVVLFGGPDAALVDLVADGEVLLPGDQAQLRVIHAADGAGNLTVRDAATGDPVFESLPYGRASVWRNVTVGTQTYRFEVGVGIPGPVQPVTLNPGAQVTLILAGDAAGDALGEGLEVLVFPFMR